MFITSKVVYSYSNEDISKTLTALKKRAEFAYENNSADHHLKKYAEINDAIASEPGKSNAGVTNYQNMVLHIKTPCLN